MLKDIIASGKLNVKDLMSYMLYHNYTKLGGILTGMLGIVGLILSPIFFIGGDKISGIAFALVALMYVVITPLDFYSKSLRQMRSNPVFKNKMTFVFKESSLSARLYTGVTEVAWDKIARVAITKEYLFIYIKDTQALIVPKRNFACADDFEIVKEFIELKELNKDEKKRSSKTSEVEEVKEDEETLVVEATVDENETTAPIENFDGEIQDSENI